MYQQIKMMNKAQKILTKFQVMEISMFMIKIFNKINK
jgi:hypothetical protein